MSWKAGINHWAMPDVPVREAAAMAKRAGFEAIELNIDETGEVGLETNRAAAQALRSAVESEGLEIGGLSTGLYWKYSPTDESAAVRARAQDIARAQLELAANLGAEVILVVPGLVGRGMGEAVVSYDAAYERAQEFLRVVAPAAESTGVVLGIENVWNKFLLSPLETVAIIDSIGSDSIQAYFDVGNILRYGYPEQWIRILGDRVARIHLKDFSRISIPEAFVDIGAGDVNWEAVGDALREANYSGPLTAEVSPDETQRADMDGYIAMIGTHVRGVMARMGAT